MYSRHAADAIEQACAVPVHVFSPPVPVLDDLAAIDRTGLGLSDDFTFLFCFDFASGFERKNPLGCRRSLPPRVRARRRAAPRDQERQRTGRARRMGAARRRRRWTAPTSRSATATRAAGRQRALMRACDCYVSLHRAEGYGLTMAEAMAAGRPVIGTAYSGNLEFMTPENSMLVPYEMVHIPFGCYPYPPDASWAEPDLDAAADAMRRAWRPTRRRPRHSVRGHGPTSPATSRSTRRLDSYGPGSTTSGAADELPRPGAIAGRAHPGRDRARTRHQRPGSLRRAQPFRRASSSAAP